MTNFLLFLSSCPLIAVFGWFFLRLGQSALTAWVSLISLLANFFVFKQITLLGLNACASDVFAIGNLLGLNLLQEKYGRPAAQTAIWTSFSCLLFFVLMSQIHIHYIPSPYDHSQAAYTFLFSGSPRILLASLVSFLISDQCDSRLYQWCRGKVPRTSLFVVSTFSMCTSQLLDTLLFSFLGLYGVVGALMEIIIVSYAVKVIAICNVMPWSFVTYRYMFKRYAAV